MIGCFAMVAETRTGLDRLLTRGLNGLKGRRVGVLTHQGAVDSGGVHLLHHLLQTVGPPHHLWSPEHGLWATHQDMETVNDAPRDPVFDLPVRSLYGKEESTLGACRRELEELDLLIVDLQDVGARYYTYAATVYRTLANASGLDLEVLLLDRPNPIGGAIEGGLVAPEYRSYVGEFSIPHRHGMTLGELTLLGALEGGLDLSIEVLPVEGWNPQMNFVDTGLPWIPPSPNMPSLATALVYPGGCLVEGTLLSEGRGTTTPFEVVGAPFVDARRWVATLEEMKLPGVRFLPTAFRPMFQKHAGVVCNGVRLVVTEPRRFHSLACGLALLQSAFRLWPDSFEWRTKEYEFVTDRLAIDLLLGQSWIRPALESGEPLWTTVSRMEEGTEQFLERRESALLYARGGQE